MSSSLLSESNSFDLHLRVILHNIAVVVRNSGICERGAWPCALAVPLVSSATTTSGRVNLDKKNYLAVTIKCNAKTEVENQNQAIVQIP